MSISAKLLIFCLWPILLFVGCRTIDRSARAERYQCSGATHYNDVNLNCKREATEISHRPLFGE